MSMRSQIYQWNSQAGTAVTSVIGAANQLGQAVSIFIGGFGNNITKPAETTATQFVVIEDVAVSPTYFVYSGIGTVAAPVTIRGLIVGAEGATMVFRVRQVHTHAVSISNLVSTFTPMSMCFRVKCLMLL